MTELEGLITRANDVLAVLEGLVKGETAETLVPTMFGGLISYNETTKEWTLSQDTADTDGLYKGQYTLAEASSCATLELVSQDVVTPDDGTPARYRVCAGDTWTDITNIANLHLQKLSGVEVRSKNPYTVTARLHSDWCYSWDFAQGVTDWTILEGAPTLGASHNKISLTFPVGVTLKEITVHMSGVGSGSSYLRYYITQDSVNTMVLNTTLVNGSRTWTGSQENVSAVHIDGSRSYSWNLTGVDLKGEGFRPLGEDTCP